MLIKRRAGGRQGAVYVRTPTVGSLFRIVLQSFRAWYKELVPSVMDRFLVVSNTYLPTYLPTCSNTSAPGCRCRRGQLACASVLSSHIFVGRDFFPSLSVLGFSPRRAVTGTCVRVTSKCHKCGEPVKHNILEQGHIMPLQNNRALWDVHLNLADFKQWLSVLHLFKRTGRFLGSNAALLSLPFACPYCIQKQSQPTV
jgi:hypothetical protein